MKGRIILSCGHDATEDDRGEDVRYKEQGCDAITGYYNCVAYATYCRSCAANMRASDAWINSDEEEQAWFEAGRK